MSKLDQHIKLLGFKAKDKVTGFSGIIDSISFDLYGCIQATIKPSKLNSDGMVQEGMWFDVTRLDVTSKKAVIDPPRFDLGYIAEGRKGAAEKPSRKT